MSEESDRWNAEELTAALASSVPRTLVGTEKHETGGVISVHIETHKYGNNSRFQVRMFYTAPEDKEPCGTWLYGGSLKPWNVGLLWVAQKRAEEQLAMIAAATRDWHKGY